MDASNFANPTARSRFPALTLEVLQRLASSASPVNAVAGDVLFREGGENDRLMIVVQGRIALDMHVPGRGLIRVQTLGPGDIVAWSAVLANGRMTTTATAVEDSTLMAISGAAVRALCEADHEFGYHFMLELGVALSERLLATRLQLLDLFADRTPDGAREDD